MLHGRRFSIEWVVSCVLAVVGCTPGQPAAPEDRPRLVLRLLTHVPMTGPLAAYTAVSRAAQAYFEDQNERGGVLGSSIELSIVDSGDSPEVTRSAVLSQLSRGDIFAVFSPVGDPGQLALLDDLDARGVPTFFMASGLSVYTRPFRPNVFVSNPTYEEIGRALAAYLITHWPAARIALVFLGRPSGREFAAGVQRALPTGAIAFNEEVQFDTDPEGLAARLARSGSDAVVAFMLSEGFLGLVRAGSATGFRPRWASAFLDRLIEDGGESSEGILSAHWLRLPQDEQLPGTPAPDRHALEAHRALLRRRAPGLEPSAMTVGGQSKAELFIEVLKRAGPRPTPARAVQAAEQIRGWRCSLCLFDVEMSDRDHAPYDRVRILRAEHGHWVETE